VEWLRSQSWPTSPEGWVTLAAGVVIILTGLVAVVGWLIPTTRPHVVSMWRFVRSLPGRFPLRVVKSSTVASLRAHQGNPAGDALTDAPYAVVGDEPAPLLVPLTLRQRCERLASEIERAIATRDNLPSAIQGRFGDFHYFLPRLRELRQELVYEGRDPPQPLSLSNMMMELSRLEALRMVEALRNINWDEAGRVRR
jgi:hypothetical protein